MSPRPRSHPGATVALTLAATALIATGCGLTDPYQHPSTPTTNHTTTPSTSPRSSNPHAADPSEPTHPGTGPSTRSPLTTPDGHAAGRTPRAALTRYAELWANWSSQTLAPHQRELAALSGGSARAQALQAAASYQQDPELTRGHVMNHGQVIALARGQGSLHGRWVIVTQERTTGQGDYAGLPAGAHVTYARLTHTPHGWVITRWSPQN